MQQPRKCSSPVEKTPERPRTSTVPKAFRSLQVRHPSASVQSKTMIHFIFQENTCTSTMPKAFRSLQVHHPSASVHSKTMIDFMFQDQNVPIVQAALRCNNLEVLLVCREEVILGPHERHQDALVLRLAGDVHTVLLAVWKSVCKGKPKQ